MSIAADKKLIEDTLKEYRRRLDTIPDDQFNAMPPGGGWSYGEVYSHILQADLGSLIAIEKCTNGTGKVDNKRLGWFAMLIFFAGRFPPFKIKAPAKIEAAVNNIGKEEARNLIIKLKNRMDQLIPVINKSSSFSKIKHPRLGLLNAKQWFKFIGIHTKHHLKQLERIEKKIKSA
ncbi:DinB family protein [Mucilaginibacter paludis]|uniref:DinB-like domain-containing protein n=1 Tax=Mucilaginibacter paludis DSM 18603 TaxID=714943 RepID=H1YDB8_9SPHI|nr:DinB family protein [Mucilaginibacter paludis]EHQ27144.1 hypothetical protein Mucpa_3039 [Mucilaginibacter paludis DSM 18603]